VLFVAPFVAQDIEKAAKKDNVAAETLTARVEAIFRSLLFASGSTIVNPLPPSKIRRH
jgi:hypothetical protein